MAKYVAIIATIFGFIGVATGAFGAHILDGKVEPRTLITWQKGVEYMLWHTAPILFSAFLMNYFSSTAATVAGWAFIIGICLFSFSLFAIVGTGVKTLGAITPIGGVSLLVGWIALAFAVAQAFN